MYFSYLAFALNLIAVTFAIGVAVHTTGPTFGTGCGIVGGVFGMWIVFPVVCRRLRGE